MYKVIKNHYGENTTFVFKFNDEIYVINGCTLYKHSDDTVKERVYEMYDVESCYGDDIDKIARDITEDITREEMFYILQTTNVYNLFKANGLTCEIEDVGIKEIREWYLSDIDTLLKHIEVKGTVTSYYAMELLKHKDLNNLSHNTLRYIINECSEKYLNIKDIHKLDNIFSVLKTRYTNGSLVNLMYYSLKNIIIGSYKIHIPTFLDYDNLRQVIKYMRDNLCVSEYIHDDFIPRFIGGLSRDSKQQAEILMDMGIQDLLTETEYVSLFKNIVDKIFFCDGSTEFIKQVTNSSVFMKKIIGNDRLRDDYIKLVNDHNNAVMDIKTVHDKWLPKVND